jgi:4-amino-4-deoxy-L-arabinose transferase-like glycosyltransferase
VRPRSEGLVLAAIVVAAAALRFTHIGHQSFWLDESYTVDLVQRPFGDMLSGVASDESTPPLYYALAWLWEKAFGHGEAGLRSLSALFGTVTAPVAWRAAREWFDSPRAGLVAAALVAFNPFFVWYSQEARSYALLVLMVTLTLLFLARRSYAGWAVTAALALCTHYFAAFVLVPEAIWLIWTAERRRTAWIACGAVTAVVVALIPLALHQRDRGHTSFIADLSFKSRVGDLPKKLVTGELGTPTPLIGPLAGLIALIAIVYALRARPARVLIAIAAFGGLAPLVLAAFGADYVLPRNLIAVYVPVIIVAAFGLAGRRGLIGAAAICAVALVVNVEVATDVKLQRDDWRGAAKALGPAPETRVVTVTPPYDKKPLRLYAGSLPPLPPQGADVRELVAIVYGRPPADPAPPAGFPEVVERVRTPSYVLVRYRSPAPRHYAGVALIQKGPTQ